MTPALRAIIGGTILVPPLNEQSDSLWARKPVDISAGPLSQERPDVRRKAI
jgi:hypothetical protein